MQDMCHAYQVNPSFTSKDVNSSDILHFKDEHMHHISFGENQNIFRNLDASCLWRFLDFL